VKLDLFIIPCPLPVVSLRGCGGILGGKEWIAPFIQTGLVRLPFHWTSCSLAAISSMLHLQSMTRQAPVLIGYAAAGIIKKGRIRRITMSGMPKRYSLLLNPGRRRANPATRESDCLG